MNETDYEIEGSFVDIVWRDFLIGTVAVFVVICGVLMQYVRDAAASVSAEIASPGSINAMIVWPQGDIDVDMWVTGPVEPIPVGYSNKGGVLWNLLRDDVGKNPDYLPLNYENSFTRGAPPGEYRVNVHCFRCPELPIDVQLEVTIKGDMSSVPTIVGTSTITFYEDHQEKTGLAFAVDDDGKVIPSSLNTVFKPLRNAGAK